MNLRWHSKRVNTCKNLIALQPRGKPTTGVARMRDTVRTERAQGDRSGHAIRADAVRVSTYDAATSRVAAARFTIDSLSAAGTGVFVAAILSGLALRLDAGQPRCAG